MKRFTKIITAVLSIAVLLSFSAHAASGAATNTGLITYSDRKDTGDEVLFIRMDYEGTREQFVQQQYKDAAANGVKSVKTVPQKGVTALTITANYFGVIVEPVDGEEFVIDLVGVKAPKQVTVSTSVSGNTLTVDVAGDRSKSMMISTVADHRVNVVRVGVPADVLQKITLQDEKNSCILVNNLDIPVTARIGSGTARVQKDQLTSPITMQCSSGDVIVKAQQVQGTVKLTASSGDAVLLADTVSGRVELTVSSGDVAVEVDTLHSAVLQASSGDVRAKVARIGSNVRASVSSGDLTFALTQAPANLSFVFDGKERDEDVSLPKGWTNGYTVGNGEPVLHLGVGSGTLALTVGQY